MKNDAAIIEGVYDIVLPKVPTSQYRWGRIVWLQDIEVGSKGKLLYFEEGKCICTNLSRIANIVKTHESLEIYTQNNIYKLRLLPEGDYQLFRKRSEHICLQSIY